MKRGDKEETQQIVDRIMREMAVRHGSSTRRDFEVALLTIKAMEEARAIDARLTDSESGTAVGSATQTSSPRTPQRGDA